MSIATNGAKALISSEMNLSDTKRALLIGPVTIYTKGLDSIISRSLRDWEILTVDSFANGQASVAQKIPVRMIVVSLPYLLMEITVMDTLKELQADGAKLVAYSVTDSPVLIQRLRKLGFDGYCSVLRSRSSIMDLLKAVLRGQDGFVSNFRHECQVSDPCFRMERLSLRELQAMVYLGRRVPVSNISQRLGLDRSTIYQYRNRLLKKLDISSQEKLPKYLFSCGIWCPKD